MRVQAQPGYVLYARPYSESSWVLAVFTRAYGRIGLLAKGARRMESRVRGLLRPFVPLVMDWSGRGDLPYLNHAEAAGAFAGLNRDGLLCAFYMNELLLKFLPRGDPHEKLFDCYAGILKRLDGGHNREAALRVYEKILLEEVGYGLVLDREAGGASLAGEKRYRYFPERGAVVDVGDDGGDVGGVCVHGRTLLALGREDLSGPDQREESKRLLRAVIRHHLGGRELNSRKLMRRIRALEKTPPPAGPPVADAGG